jgi:hypothetical protein
MRAVLVGLVSLLAVAVLAPSASAVDVRFTTMAGVSSPGRRRSTTASACFRPGRARPATSSS